MRTWLAKAMSEGYQFAQTSFKDVGCHIAVLVSARPPPLPNPPAKSAARPASSFPTFHRYYSSELTATSCCWSASCSVFSGLDFGLVIYTRLKNLPVHRAMREISELIYETCKTYLVTQGKFLLLLWLFIAVVIVLYFGCFSPVPDKPIAVTLPIILLFSLVGIAGSYGVAWFGIRVNTFANSRTAFAGLAGKPYPIYHIPLQAGMSIGMMLISVELLIMLFILLFIPRDYAGPCFIGFAIGESLGAAALRIAGGIFTKIADIGSDLMKIVFKIKEDDARNPGVIADCTGDNAGDSVGPSADGFETYGVTGVALITFILLGVKDPTVQVQLLVWIFVMRIMMLVSSALPTSSTAPSPRRRMAMSNEMNFEAPLTSLVWITSLVSIALTYVISALIIPDLGGDTTQWWKLATIISCGTLAGAHDSGTGESLYLDRIAARAEVVTSARKAARRSEFSPVLWPAISPPIGWACMVALMSIAYLLQHHGPGTRLMIAAPVFAFGLVAFGFLGMGPVTIAVDSYGPVTDNAQSVYELSLIEQVPNIKQEIKKDFNIDVNFERAKDLLEENDGAGNTFKATAKPVLIGTAVVGATTMIFSIIMALTNGLTDKRGQAFAAARAILPWPDHGRRHDLLVHRRLHPGGDHRRVSRGRVHQGQHQARRRGEGFRRRQQEGGGDLHQVRAEGHVQHLPRGLLRDAGLRLCRAVLLYRLPDFDCDLRTLPGNLHGQRRRRLG